MIIKWWKNRKAQRKLTDQKAISEWQVLYFQDIKFPKWAPDAQVGKAEFQNLKERVVPLLYMKNHKDNIDSIEGIEAMIDFLLY